MKYVVRDSKRRIKNCEYWIYDVKEESILSNRLIVSNYVIGNKYKMLIMKKEYVSIDKYGFKDIKLISEEEKEVELVKLVKRKNGVYIDYWYKVKLDNDKEYWCSSMKMLSIYVNELKSKCVICNKDVVNVYYISDVDDGKSKLMCRKCVKLNSDKFERLSIDEKIVMIEKGVEE